MNPTTVAQREFGLISALWIRDMLRLKKERSRWIGVVAQPLLFWLFIGSGMVQQMQIEGSDSDYLAFFFPGIIVMTILFTSIFATMSVIEDRQTGFLQGILVGPGSRPGMVSGKLLGVTTLALLQCVLLFAFSPIAGFSFSRVAWGPLFLCATLSSLTLSSMNFAVAWVLNSTQAYHGFMSVLLLPLWVMSGAMYPHPGEGWLQWVMNCNPMTYAVDGMRAALSGGAVLPGAFSLEFCHLALTGFLLVFFAIALRVTRKA